MKIDKKDKRKGKKRVKVNKIKCLAMEKKFIMDFFYDRPPNFQTGENLISLLSI